MKKLFTTASLALVVMLAPSCASIVSKSSYPMEISSTPSDASILITNSEGSEVFKGKTPATVVLKASEGFFKKASYQVKFTKEGYDEKIVPVNFTLDGWYLGNILLGGLVGMLIIDPATGAMYKLDTEFLNETLTESAVSSDQPELRIYELNEIPATWKDYLVDISK